MKKTLSLVLALVMALSLAIPAFAADATLGMADLATGQEVTIEGKTQSPTISVTVPTTGNMILNPYKMGVENAEGDTVYDQIVSAAQYVSSDSDVPISVDATVSATVVDGMTLASSAVKDTETKKSVFLYFEMLNAEDGDTEPTWAGEYSSKGTGMVVVSAKGTTKADIVELGVGSEDTTYAAFHLAGNAATAPDAGWTSDDTVTVTVAFTFTAQAVAETSSEATN